MGHDVFISYSSKDRDIADAVCAAIEAKGANCWIAPRDILPGADWSASIVHAIADAKVFVLIFSGSANTSPQIKREVERAVNRGIAVIPVRVADVRPSDSLEYFISTPHWLDAFPPPFDDHLDYIANTVHGVLQGATAPVTRPKRKVAVAALANYRAFLIGGAAVALAAVLGVAGWMIFGGDSAPEYAAVCRVKVGDPSPQVCGQLLAQNAEWQHCSSTFAQQDMDRAAQRAMQGIDDGGAGSALYYDAKYYDGMYGNISHYWEMLGECVETKQLPFERLSGNVAFPQYFWTRTHGVRQTFLSHWNGKNAPLPDFMSNFQALCLKYKAERNAVRPGGGDSLDCSL